MGQAQSNDEEAATLEGEPVKSTVPMEGGVTKHLRGQFEAKINGGDEASPLNGERTVGAPPTPTTGVTQQRRSIFEAKSRGEDLVGEAALSGEDNEAPAEEASPTTSTMNQRSLS